MRHLKAGRALGVKPAHRQAMMRNLVTSVLEHGRVRTTIARAKELRKPLDRMITLGKKGDLAARRQALAFVKTKKSMAALFGDLAERYKERPGGYSRILKTGPRRGDGAEMALVILVGGENDPLAEEKKPRRRAAKKSRKVLEQVAEDVSGGDAPKAAAKGGSSKAASRASDAKETDEAPAADAEEKSE